jgi:glycosyltransferase involved in cell wall biosynthesis
MNDCSNCTQLKDNLFDVTAAVLEDKIKLFAGANLTIVTPSQWLSSCAKKSKLFKKFRVETIPYSLETDTFVPISKEKAKQKLGVSENVNTLLFSAELGNEKRKGFSEFAQAIDVCLKDSRFKDLAKRGLVKLLCLGLPSDELTKLPIDTISLGYLREDKKISEVYSAADIFILPSLEDNLPNTMLESMSCGTPVVTFDTGGMPDLVKDRLTGRLIPLLNVKKMGEAILDLIFNSGKRVKMGIECRKKMESEFNLSVQAKNYKDLYQDLLEKTGTSTFKTKQDTEKSFFSNTQELSVKLNVTVGPALQNSNDNILTKMLLKAYYRQIADRGMFIKNIKNLFSWLSIALLRK